MKLEDMKMYGHRNGDAEYYRIEDVQTLHAAHKHREKELYNSDQTLLQLAHMLGVDPDKRATDAMTRAVRNLQIRVRA